MPRDPDLAAARPCPFCGGVDLEPDWIHPVRDDAGDQRAPLVAYLSCKTCNCMGPESGPHPESTDPRILVAAAVAAWNRRA